MHVFPWGDRMATTIARNESDALGVPDGTSRRATAGLACPIRIAGSYESCQVRPASQSAVFPRVGVSVLAAFKHSERCFPAGHHFIEQYESGENFYAIVDGWAIQYELLEDGRRQILDLLLPGSVTGFQLDTAEPSSYSVQALTEVRACGFPIAGFLAAAESKPAPALCLAAATLECQRRLLQHLTRIGRRAAKERVAALLLDLYYRVRGGSPLRKGDRIALPLTQEQMADALGLTNVHVNRMLRELREEGVLILKDGTLQILDPHRLVAICDPRDRPLVQHGLSARRPLGAG